MLNLNCSNFSNSQACKTVLFLKMNWICKICKFEKPRKTDLLKHYRLRHGRNGEVFPCLYWECYCSFKTWGSLRTHLSRHHSTRATVTQSEILSFKCPCCSLNTISTERAYFEHKNRKLSLVFLKIVLSKQTFMEHMPLIGAGNTLPTRWTSSSLSFCRGMSIL